MAAGKPSPQAFTVKYLGLSDVLKSKARIAVAFKPQDPLVQPDGYEYDCIWDTGATGTVITRKIVEDLNLQPTGKAVCCTVGGAKESNTYLISVALPNNVIFSSLRVVEGEVQGADALIGMDIILMGDFAITNRNHSTTMSYQWPATHEIDFVDEINRRKLIPQHHEMTDEEKRKAKNKQKRDRKKKGRGRH